MIGSDGSRPPFPVTLDNWQTADQLPWTFQHMAEIFPTAPIRRGDGPVARLVGTSYDATALPVVVPDGRQFSVGQIIGYTDTDGWMIIFSVDRGCSLSSTRAPWGRARCT